MTKPLHGRTAAQTLDACCNHLRAAHIDAALAAELRATPPEQSASQQSSKPPSSTPTDCISSRRPMSSPAGT